MFDCHVHSTISIDGKSSIIDMCLTAISKSISTICFTEHFDMNPLDPNYKLYNHEKYTAEIEQARRLFSNKLEILQGIEFSEPNQYPHEFDIIIKKKFDFILGSMHWCFNTWAGAYGPKLEHSIEEMYEMHYSETIKMVNFGGFDSLAHIDLPRRYTDNYKEPNDIIDEILSALIKYNISLELNSSPLRKGKNFILPSQSILQKYKDMGGKNVTMGSDAHNSDEICFGNEYLENQITLFQLEPVIYRQRKPNRMAS
jgi:histidinol-phosphatase (PHP family)